MNILLDNVLYIYIYISRFVEVYKLVGDIHGHLSELHQQTSLALSVS